MTRYASALAFLLTFSVFSCRSQQQATSFNLGFEQLDAKGQPQDWALGWGKSNMGYEARTDRKVKQEGNVSMSISKVADSGTFGVCAYAIPAQYKGDTLVLRGYLKTEDVAGGYAGLWMRIDNQEGPADFDNMNSRGVTGSSGWKQYEIRLPYQARNAMVINLGGLLTGKGRMWIDNLQLFLDGQPIEKAPLKPQPKGMQWQDTLAFPTSGTAEIKPDSSNTRILTHLGMLWGFLKYYHPAIAGGKYNWDAELFRILPRILSASDAQAAYRIMEEWVDGLGPVAACNNCKPAVGGKLEPDYGYLFVPGHLPPSLVRKLAFIRDNHPAPEEHYYIDLFSHVHNPDFRHEVRYSAQQYPDAGLRLLALYRYWSMIQYFYPNRHLIGEDWNAVLADALPSFVQAGNRGEYVMACLALIGRVHDTHANIWGDNATLDSLKGKLILPFRVAFVEDRLVVTGYYNETKDSTRQGIRVGDVVEQIDGVPVAELVQKYLPYTPASNYSTQLHVMSSGIGFLLRSNKDKALLSLSGERGSRQMAADRVPVTEEILKQGRPQYRERQSHKLLHKDIGYIFPARLTDESVDTIKKAFSHTKAIVIDLRCYPSAFMPFSYGAWMKPVASHFVKFTEADLTHPGAFGYRVGDVNGYAGQETYKGQVVILVNAQTQSQAEYTTMALSTIPGAVVIGETTAGADGNISKLWLPGDIFTVISGIGILYPDGTETQRKGVKIDIEAHPTIKGIRAGRDELLERALSYIEEHQ